MSKKATHRMRNACLGKVKHATELAADTALDLMQTTPGHAVEKYLCEYCQHWHIGHKLGTKKIKQKTQHERPIGRSPQNQHTELYSRTKVAKELIQMAYNLQAQQADLNRMHVLTNNRYFADLIDRTEMLAIKVRHQSECMGATWQHNVNNPEYLQWTATISGKEILPLNYIVKTPHGASQNPTEINF